MRWWTADRLARADAQGQWVLETQPYLGADAQGRLCVHQAQKPSSPAIIHDLGHVLVTPLRAAARASHGTSPTALPGWLWDRLEIDPAALDARAQGLALGEGLDLLVWDLDAPALEGESTSDKCEWVLREGGVLRAVWISGVFCLSL